MASEYLQSPISNGNPREQALIRRWWYERHGARGRLVWEYYLEGKYADAIWFPDSPGVGVEESGRQAPDRFPLSGTEVVLCEAKLDLTPEVVGQALVYRQFVTHAGASLRQTVVFSETGSDAMRRAAAELGLLVVVEPI